MGDPATVADVVERIREIDAELPPRDGVGVFNRVYLRVTELVMARLAEGGFFRDDEFMASLDVTFADLWFTAYDASPRRMPKAWAPLFEARDERGVLPIQFALAGMNAHIEHDLAVAVVRTCQAHGRSPTSPGVHHDYEQVNDLLAGVEAEIRRSFLTEVGHAVDDQLLRPVAHLVSSWNIDKARDIAWVNALALWELRRVDFLFDRYAGALAHSVGMGSRLLLTDVLPDR
ncbi:DUF5995 family protein [Nocardioides speluncae]|uniref:DUF5995 family protein n=1 Tax=Nocardioides speluncae TaxID=2670337 RepID=UPI000D686A8C|nr:DUF5995 family protein [Nocardioides speluncae]